MPNEVLRIERVLADPEADADAIDAAFANLDALRAASPDGARSIDRHVVETLRRTHRALNVAREAEKKQKSLVDLLTAPAHFPAILVDVRETAAGARALVVHLGGRRIVTLHPDVDPSALRAGDEVLLAAEGQSIVDVSPFPPSMHDASQTASFERFTADGHAVLSHRDEVLVVDVAQRLRDAGLASGELVRFGHGMAFEKIEREEPSSYFIEETPTETFDDVRGLEPQVREIIENIDGHLGFDPRAGTYKLSFVHGITMYGPPGTGKTLLAKATANYIARRSGGARVQFASVKPAELHSAYYSETERRYREFFRSLKAAAMRSNAIVLAFFDEVDSVGGSRGRSHMQIHDQVLTSLMTELEGFDARTQILVMAATNRIDMLDPALVRPGRLGDLKLHIPRPGRKAAAQILDRHLPRGIPYRDEEGQADADTVRERAIERTVAWAYADASAHIATVSFRSGATRTLRVPDLVSGAHLKKIADDAVRRAWRRDRAHGIEGVTASDLLQAAEDEFRSLAATLSPSNVHQYATLPTDMEVVKVEAAAAPPAPHRYLRLA